MQVRCPSIQLIFQWLSNLTPVQASDERLWVLLTHRHFADYMHKRWGQKRFESAKNPEAVVLDRCFYHGQGLRTCVHNGISRLWVVRLSDLRFQTALNPFELTDTLLSLQDIPNCLLGTVFGALPPLAESGLGYS